MCLDPRPDRLARSTRPRRRLPRALSEVERASRTSLFHAPVLAHGLHVAAPAPVVRAPALWALEHLAGDDDLVARGWVVLSREV
jgi:hypothetical protein